MPQGRWLFSKAVKTTRETSDGTTALQRSATRGLTLVELLVVIAILSVLAAAAMPLSQMSVKRVKEAELRRNLRIIRTTLDEFRKD